MIDIAAEISTALAPVLVELRAARAELAEIRAVLPPRMISLAEARERMGGIDGRTILAMIQRSEIIGRRAGRRWLVDGSSLKPTSPATVATMARAARAGT
jgi:hypothetical protein